MMDAPPLRSEKAAPLLLFSSSKRHNLDSTLLLYGFLRKTPDEDKAAEAGDASAWATDIGDNIATPPLDEISSSPGPLRSVALPKCVDVAFEEDRMCM